MTITLVYKQIELFTYLVARFSVAREIYFCHVYREHLSKESSAVQNEYMNTFLGQWESAVQFGNPVEPNETHICGDFNIDVFQGRWLQPDYPLVSLSRLVKNACHLNNFHQLVKEITRVQYNSVSKTTESSCIDHIYTNAKFRCSNPAVVSFGDSDHDLLQYTRYSKINSDVARTVYKRSYKKFDESKFLQDLSVIDWYDVYGCDDVNSAVEAFTIKFRHILNSHAPWIKVQQRKNFAPWLTSETKRLMTERDK